MRFRIGRHRDLDNSSDEALMHQIGRGDRAALDALYRRHGRRMLAYFSRMLRGDALAEDMLHDLFLKIITSAGSYRSGHAFQTWLFSIAHNMCKNEYRRREIRDRFVVRDVVEGSSAAFEVENGAFVRVLDFELDQLDAEQRSTFLLRYQEGLSIREIAEALDCAEGTVKSRLHNITRRLATRLHQFNPEFSEVAHERDR